MPFDPDRHRRRSIRLPAYDYAGDGAYFITIRTAEREMLFGRIRDGAMILNELGWLVWEEWERSAEVRPWIALDSFVVMPNHIHGLVTIIPDDNPSLGSRAPVAAPLKRRSRSLGSFVAGFKGATAARINALRGTAETLVWQRNYYERIVRNEQMRTRLWTYFEHNPLQWAMDRENPNRDREDDIEAWLFADPGTNRNQRLQPPLVGAHRCAPFGRMIGCAMAARYPSHPGAHRCAPTI